MARDGLTLATLPRGAKVATGSPRRVAQLKRARPDLQILGLRGNVDTRLRRVKDGDFDAVVLALAGLKRLQRDGEVTDILDPSVMMPAPAPGGARAHDPRGRRARRGSPAPGDGRPGRGRGRRPSAPRSTGSAPAATRRWGPSPRSTTAGCVLRVRVLSLDGTQCLEEAGEASVSEARTLGLSLAKALLARGAGPLVAS